MAPFRDKRERGLIGKSFWGPLLLCMTLSATAAACGSTPLASGSARHSRHPSVSPRAAGSQDSVVLQTASTSGLASSGIVLTPPPAGVTPGVSASAASATAVQHANWAVQDTQLVSFSSENTVPPVSDELVYVVEMKVPPGTALGSVGPANPNGIPVSRTPPPTTFYIVFVNATSGTFMLAISN